MASGSRHQAEPWIVKGRQVLSSSGRPVATVVYPADARRIVAVVNSMEGISSSVLGNALVRNLLDTLIAASDSDRKAAKRWLEEAHRREARDPGRKAPTKPVRREGWPPAVKRIVSAMKDVGISTRTLDPEAIKEILAVVALAPAGDLRVVSRWLRETRRQSARKSR